METHARCIDGFAIIQKSCATNKRNSTEKGSAAKNILAEGTAEHEGSMYFIRDQYKSNLHSENEVLYMGYNHMEYKYSV